MNSDKLSPCELWNLTTPRLPSHSQLYALEPLGLGTWKTESLTSYLTRLAEAHCVSLRDLVFHELLPLMERPYLSKPISNCLSSFWKEAARAINGTGILAQDWARTLEHLTLITDLHFLTLLPWAPVMTTQRLLRSTRAWCPECFAEWQETGQPIYEPLLWNLNVVTICPHHQRYLRQQCPYPDCQETLPLLSAHIHPGYCSKCAKWLGITTGKINESPLSAEMWDWHTWVIKATGELLARAPILTVTPHLNNIPNLIAAYLLQAANGKVAVLAQNLQLSRRTIRSWQQGVQIPQLESLLRLCYCCNISPFSLLTTDPGLLNVTGLKVRSLPAFPHPPKKRRRPFDANLIQRVLEKSLESEESPPPAMRTVAQRLDYSPRQLREHFPDLCKTISMRYQNYQRICGERRVEQMKKEIRRVTLKAHIQGLYPSENQVTALLSDPGFMANPNARHIWQEALRELGYEY